VRVPLTLCLALVLAASSSLVCAQDAPPTETARQTTEPDPPIYEAWWFWVAIFATVAGVTTAVIVDVTTDDPAPSSAGLTLRF
jgi:hypothetical protein